MSTIKVTNIKHGSTSNGGIQLDSSGHVTIDGQQLPTAGALSNRNLIINGSMQVAQRGTSSTSSGFATVDRIEGGFSGGAVTQSQGTLTTGAGDSTVYDLGFRHYFRQTNTTAASGASNHRNIRYRVEAQDLATSGWNYTNSGSYITFSFYVRSSVAQQFYGYIRTENGTERIYPFSTGSLSADTWTKVEKTIPGDSSITIPNDNSSGVQILIAPFWGTDFTDSGVSLDAWANYVSGSRAPDYTTTWAATASATFDLTGLQLEVGEKATPFEHRSYGDELARCRRYYYRVNSQTSYTPYGFGHNRTTSSGQAIVQHPVEMRAAPSSLDYSNLASGVLGVSDVLITSAALNAAGNGKLMSTVDTASSGAFTTGFFTLMAKNTTSSHIGFSAEL